MAFSQNSLGNRGEPLKLAPAAGPRGARKMAPQARGGCSTRLLRAPLRRARRPRQGAPAAGPLDLTTFPALLTPAMPGLLAKDGD